MWANLVAVIYAITMLGCSPLQKPESVLLKKNADIEKLIDGLVDLGKSTTGAHPTAWGEQFMAIDEEPEFRGGIIGSEKPTVDPTMRKLVQLGVRALPILMKHLDDKRETKLVIKHDQGFGAMWYSDEYDPRYGDKVRQPKNVNSDEKMSHTFDHTIKKFTLHVGDACYIAIGQIVNRGLSVIRYQPTACIVVNSPIQSPALAAAVRQEWSGLTETDHAKQLENDSYSLYPYSSEAAIKHLLYFYPVAGERVALRLLNRKIYDSGAIWEVGEKMMKFDSEKDWNRIYKETQRKFGRDAAELIPHWINWIYFVASFERTTAQQGKAKLICKTIAPKYDPAINVYHPVYEDRDQADLIRSLKNVKNPKFDSAIQEVFRDAVSSKGKPDLTQESERRRIDGLDLIAKVCFERMHGKGFDKEYLAYFEPRVFETEKYSKEEWEKQELDELKERVKKLKQDSSN